MHLIQLQSLPLKACLSMRSILQNATVLNNFNVIVGLLKAILKKFKKKRISKKDYQK